MPKYFQSASSYYLKKNRKNKKLLLAGSFMVGGNAGDVAPLIALKQFFEEKDFSFDVEVLSSSSSSYDSFDCFYFLEQLNQGLVDYLCDNAGLLMVIGGGAFYGVETVIKLAPFIERLKSKTAMFAIGTDYERRLHDVLIDQKHERIANLLNGIKHLSTRTHYSQKICKHLGLKPNEDAPIGDIVHLLQTMPGFYNLRDGFTIAVNLRYMWIQNDIFANYIASVIDALIEKYNAKIIFIPFSFRNDPDTLAHENVVKRMKYKDKAFVIRRHIYPAHLQDIISQTDLLIGMRLHANVMAYNTQVPFVAIDYHPKVAAFMEQVGLNENILLKGNPVSTNFGYGYAEPDYYMSLEESVSHIEKCLLRNPSVAFLTQKQIVETKLIQLLEDSFSENTRRLIHDDIAFNAGVSS